MSKFKQSDLSAEHFETKLDEISGYVYHLKQVLANRSSMGDWVFWSSIQNYAKYINQAALQAACAAAVGEERSRLEE